MCGSRGVHLPSLLSVTLAGSLALSGFDSMGYSLYVRKVSDVRLISVWAQTSLEKKAAHISLLSLPYQFHLEISPHLVLKQAD